MSSWRIKTSPQSEEVRFSIWSVDVTLTDCDNLNKSLYRERQDKNKSKNLQQGKSYMFYPNAHVILLYLYCSILCIVFEKWIISCHISKQVCRAAAAAAKLLQSCLTLCNPIYGSPPGSPSLGFSRQEYWSGLPFPSPSMKVKSESEVTQSCPTPCDPMDCSLPGSSVHGILQARVRESGAT